MANYKLFTGGPYKQRNSAAITATSTRINSGAALNIGTSQLLEETEKKTSVDNIYALSIDGISSVLVTLAPNTIDTSGPTEAYTLVVFSDNTDGFFVGQIILVLVTGGQQVTGKVLTVSEFEITFSPAVQEVTDIYLTVGDIGVIENGQYQIRKVDMSDASDYGRSKVHKTNAVRTRKTNTAIRAGKYDFVSGEFDAFFPQTSNDFTSMDIDGSDVPDDEAKSATGKREVGGEITYRDGGRIATSQDYQAKTS